MTSPWILPRNICGRWLKHRYAAPENRRQMQPDENGHEVGRNQHKWQVGHEAGSKLAGRVPASEQGRRVMTDALCGNLMLMSVFLVAL